MRIQDSVEATVEVEEVKIEDGRLVLEGQLRVGVEMPPQDAHLPQQLEAAIERAGQPLKRQLFAHALQRADLELVLAQRQGKHGEGLQRRGYAPYTFKTIFGTVELERMRIVHAAEGSSPIPSAHAWQTPQQVGITEGLREAVCETLLAEPTTATLAAVEVRAGEDGLLGRSPVLKIVHEEGGEVRAAQHQRAEAVWHAHPEAQARLLGGAARGSSERGEEAAVEAEAGQEEAEAPGEEALGPP